MIEVVAEPGCDVFPVVVVVPVCGQHLNTCMGRGGDTTHRKGGDTWGNGGVDVLEWVIVALSSDASS